MPKGDTRRLIDIMAALRTPGSGCPWDLEQDFRSIAPYTVEEAYEVAEAIEHHDMGALRDELGDLLFQVVFHARMAEEAGAFGYDDVVAAACDKMTRRHPHVFGDATVASAADQTRAWEAHKAAERASRYGGEASRMDGVSVTLPAMLRALKLQRRAARAGFDWPDAGGVLAKLGEETAELEAARQEGREAIARELGDLLFTVVNLARHLDVEPEWALRGANRRFEERFRAMEITAAGQGSALEEMSLDELEGLWQRAKGGRGEEGGGGA